MKCPYCHSEINDEAVYCSECGKKIVQETLNSSVGSRVQNRQTKTQNKNNKVMLIIGVIAIGILIGAICYFLLFKDTDEKSDTVKKEATTEKTESDEKIELEADSLTVKVGETEYIEANMDCTYSVKDETVCEVDQFGTVKGLKAGETTVTCKGENGTKATCKITVEEGETISGDYVFPNSSSVLLTENDLAGKSEWELRIGINEIYARHHCSFKTAEIADYFKGKSWYSADPNLTSDMMNADVSKYLNDIEVKNVNFIRNYQETH